MALRQQPSEVRESSGTLGAADAKVTVTFTLSGGGFRYAGVQLVKPSAFSGTVTFQGTVDGTNWFALEAKTMAASGTVVTTATDAGAWRCDVQGLSGIRANVTAFTSGALTCTIRVVA